MPQTAMPRRQVTFADWGAVYKVALGVMAVGVLVVVGSPFLGGPLYTTALLPLLKRLPVPEDTTYSLSLEPQTGAEMLALLGGSYVAVGFCMFCARLVVELLGLGEPALTRRMRPPGKLALGTAAAGVVAFVAGWLIQSYLELLFDDYYSSLLGAATRTLDLLAQAGLLLLLCSILTLFLRRGSRYDVLIRLTDVVGWGRIRCGWINKLALSMVAGGLIGMLRFIMPFDDVATPFMNAGIAILALGIIPQFVGKGRGP